MNPPNNAGANPNHTIVTQAGEHRAADKTSAFVAAQGAPMSAEQFWLKQTGQNFGLSDPGYRRFAFTFAEAYAASLLASRDRELREMREALQAALDWQCGPFAGTSQIAIPAWVERAKQLLAVVR